MPGRSASPEAVRQAAGQLRVYVTEKLTFLGGMEGQLVGVHVRSGDAASQIGQLAGEVGADVIVVGAHKATNVRNLLLGTTAQRVMSTAKCSVLVAGPKPPPVPSHVITIDGPCPDCLDARGATQGRSWWCARHSESHHLRHHHVYSYQTRLPYAEHDSEVTPTGI
jgi:hypothetical protein